MEGQQLGNFLPLLRLHLFQDFFRRFLRQVAQEVGGGIGVHLFHDVGGLVGIDGAHELDLHLGIDLFQRLGGHFFRQRLEDGFALGRRQLFQNVGNIGRMQLGEPA